MLLKWQKIGLSVGVNNLAPIFGVRSSKLFNSLKVYN